ncbi:alpha/beta fold hydrolase [Streptomyces sp. NPDC091294]|uniref:alpha/beta fold hydrolase n=1 Tax=Streptomyces sp. NPDC091294 TaxID=3365992 RepID=UPI003827A623
MTAHPHPTGLLSLPGERRLAWDEHGPADGNPVFLFHGSPSCRVMWSGLADVASATGTRLIVPDRPGCGRSTHQPGRRLTDWPQDVAALTDHLGLERFQVVGLSGGGPYALACAATADARLAGTAVVNGVGPLDTPEAVAGLYDTNRFIFEAARRGPDSLAPVVSRLIGGTGGNGGDSLAALLAGMSPEDRANAAAHPELLTDSLDLDETAAGGIEGVTHDLWLSVQPWGFDLDRIAGPVDFFASDHDRNVPVRHAVDQAEHVPHSTLTVWPGTGHSHAFTRLPEVLRRLQARLPGHRP